MLINRQIKPLTTEKYREIFDFPVKDYYQRAGFDFNKESFEKLGTEFIKTYNKRQKECDLHIDTKNILNFIKQQGIEQSILSARKQDALLIELKNYKIDNYFSLICGLQDHYAHGKIENAERLIQKINLPLSEIILIGDTLHDHEVAQHVGISSILLSHGHHNEYKLKQANITILQSLSDFLHLNKTL